MYAIVLNFSFFISMIFLGNKMLDILVVEPETNK